VVHQRTLVWLGCDGAVVVDRLLCAKPHEVRSRLHFAETVKRPFGWSIARPEVEVSVDDATVVIQPAAGPPVRLEPR